MYTDNQIRAFCQLGYAELAKGFESHGGQGQKVRLTEILSENDRKELALRGANERDYSRWYVVAVHDTNAANGFYACVIETSPGSAVISFRGSERMEYGFSNLQHDWVEADLGLLNATATEQQREADRFLCESRPLLARYLCITLTGHSLGGNLAEYAALQFEKYGLADRLEQCVSMDGPGFSDEFIAQYRDVLRRISAKMKHYRWSFVGWLLNDLPGVKYRCLRVHNISKLDQYNILTRHDPKYLDVDQNGNFQEGSQDLLALYSGRLSRYVDCLPKQKGDKIKYTLSQLTLKTGRTVYKIADMKKSLQKTAYRGKKPGDAARPEGKKKRRREKKRLKKPAAGYSG